MLSVDPNDDSVKNTKSRRRVKLAFIGCGHISLKHLAAIAAASPRLIDVTCVVDPDQERRQLLSAKIEKLFSLKPVGFSSLQEALEADSNGSLFEAVDIMVPSLGTLHEEVAIDAMKGNKHVILEKPIAVIPKSGERIIEAGRKLIPNKVLMVAENSNYWPEVVEAKKHIEQGKIGDVLTARAKYWESADIRLNEWAQGYAPDKWNCTNEGPGCGFTFDGGLHWLRPLRMWMGEVSEVVAIADKSLDRMKGPSIVHALLKFESSKTAIFESVLAPAGISDQSFFTIQGSKGEIVIDGFEGGCREYVEVRDGKCIAKDICNKGWDESYKYELIDFALAIINGKRLDAGPEEALADLYLMDAIIKSTKSGKWEKVPSLRFFLENLTKKEKEIDNPSISKKRKILKN